LALEYPVQEAIESLFSTIPMGQKQVVISISIKPDKLTYNCTTGVTSKALRTMIYF